MQGVSPDIVSSRYHAGIGYITIPVNVDRNRYISECLSAGVVSILTEEDSVLHRVLIDSFTLNKISFPDSAIQKGTKILWVNVPLYDYPVIVCSFLDQNSLNSSVEGEYDLVREFNGVRAELSLNPNKKSITLVIDGDDADCQLNISNYRGTVNIQANQVNHIFNVETKLGYQSSTQTIKSQDSSSSIEQTDDTFQYQTKNFIINGGGNQGVLGNELVSLLNNLIIEIASSTVTTALGIQPLINALRIQSYTDQLNNILSQIVTLD